MEIQAISFFLLNFCILLLLQDMIRAISELESDRQPLATRYDKKTKSTTAGIMQLLPETADWLARYQKYALISFEAHNSYTEQQCCLSTFYVILLQ